MVLFVYFGLFGPLSPLWFIQPIQSILPSLDYSIHYSPFGPFSLFDPLRSIQSISVHFGQFNFIDVLALLGGEVCVEEWVISLIFIGLVQEINVYVIGIYSFGYLILKLLFSRGLNLKLNIAKAYVIEDDCFSSKTEVIDNLLRSWTKFMTFWNQLGISKKYFDSWMIECLNNIFKMIYTRAFKTPNFQWEYSGGALISLESNINSNSQIQLITLSVHEHFEMSYVRQ